MDPNAPDFRWAARERLERAKAELAANDPVRLRYAALELREAMEALTFDRALAVKDEISPEEFKTWQPRRLMAVIHDIDSAIGKTSSLAFGLEHEYGVPPPDEEMKFLGTDVVFNMANLKDHYDAIGSYLHMPSLEQINTGRLPDPAKLRERCDAIVVLIENVLASPVFNVTFGVFSTLDQCLNCGKPVRKRIPSGKTELSVKCFECKASYTVKVISDDKVTWHPVQQSHPCPTEGCDRTISLWDHQVKPGTYWRCAGCGISYEVTLGVGLREDPNAPEGAGHAS